MLVIVVVVVVVVIVKPKGAGGGRSVLIGEKERTSTRNRSTAERAGPENECRGTSSVRPESCPVGGQERGGGGQTKRKKRRGAAWSRWSSTRGITPHADVSSRQLNEPRSFIFCSVSMLYIPHHRRPR